MKTKAQNDLRFAVNFNNKKVIYKNIKKLKEIISPLIVGDGKEVTGSREKAELLKSFFVSIFTQKEKNNPNSQKQSCKRQIRNTNQNRQEISKRTPIHSR
uniref:Uncharacterized protein n=1 Tax=Micrurus paraensis TaxID=1970185 RepID=A0A2D4K4F2_9SAUR